ncbi:MAG: AEC family transporter [Ruminiclostridium sp.]|nr:AEC family transporter [Ruminiclostridium sp.]
MESASQAVLTQTIIMFIIVIIGALCYKFRLITDDGKKQLSSLVMYIVNPLLIFLAYQTDFKKELLIGLMWTAIMAVLTYIVFILLSMVIIRDKEGRETAIERFSVIYSNCGFMGTPLIFGVFGSEGVFLQNGFITVFNLCVWTHGIMSVKGQRDMKSILRAFKAPAVIAVFLGLVLFFLGVRIPEIPYTALNHVGEMTTPLAMLVAGASIAGSNILKSLKNPRIYLITFLKLIVFPLIGLLIIAFLPAPETAKLITLIEIACPTATIGMMFAITFNKNAEYSSQIFAVTTLLSMATLPFIVWVGTAFLQAIA